MAKDKIIPTWIKIAALAALVVPYSVKLDKDEDNKIKKLRARSLTADISYTPSEGDKESELQVAFFGRCGEGKKGKKVHINKAAVRDDLSRFCDKATVKAKDCAKKMAELCDRYVVTEEGADAEDASAEEAEPLV